MALQLQQLHVANINEIQDGTIDFRQVGPVLGLYPLSQATATVQVGDIFRFMRELMNRGQTEGYFKDTTSLATLKQISQIELTFQLDQALITYQVAFTQTNLFKWKMYGVQVVGEKVYCQDTAAAPKQILLDYRNPDLATTKKVAMHLPLWHLTPKARQRIGKWHLLKQLQQEIEAHNSSFLFSWGCDNLLAQRVLPQRLGEVRTQFIDWLRQISLYTFHETNDLEPAFPLPNHFSGLMPIAMDKPELVLEGDYRESQRIVRQINYILAVLQPGLQLDIFQNSFHNWHRIRINTQQGPQLNELPLPLKHVIFCLGGLIEAYRNPNALVVLPRAALDVPRFTALMAVLAKNAKGQVIFTAADARLLTPLQPTACLVITDQKKAHYQPWTPHAFPVQPAETPCVSLLALRKAFEQATTFAMQF